MPGTSRNIQTLPQSDDSCGDKRKFTLFKKTHPLRKAGGVFGDKGFIGTDYITTPIRKPECRELLNWEHAWNNQVSSFRAPVRQPPFVS